MHDGRRVLITGANRGIGSAVLEKFLSYGALVYAHARSESPEFSAHLRALEDAYSTEIQPVIFDLTDAEAMAEALLPSTGVVGEVDVLVNNAGVAHGGLFQMTRMAEIRDVFEVNFFAQLNLTQKVLKRMIRKRRGAIVNVGSIAGLDMLAGNSAYGASKAAFMAWTRTLAAETGALGVRVNAVAPGLARTDMADRMERRAGERMLQASAMQRKAQPEEIAEVVAFLASDRASFVNGQVIRVDGGAA